MTVENLAKITCNIYSVSSAVSKLISPQTRLPFVEIKETSTKKNMQRELTIFAGKRQQQKQKSDKWG
jgi:hypothetical protein